MVSVVRRGKTLVAVVSSVVALLAIPSRTYGQSLSVTPSAGAGGITVTITASGFDPGHVGYNTGFYYTSDGVHLGFLGACPGPAGTDAWANCSIQATMPSPSGEYTLEAFNSNHELATTTFTALNPSMNITPTCGPDLTSAITVTGERWAVGHVGIYVDGSLVADVLTSSGDFTQEIDAPSSPDGPHTIQVSNSVRQILSRTFTTPICSDIGAATEVQGDVTVTHADGTKEPLWAGAPIRKDDAISTGDGSRVVVLFTDGTSFVVSADTKITFDDYVYNPSTHAGTSFYSVVKGIFEYTSGLIGHTEPPSQNIDTVYGTIGIRGTEFIYQHGSTSDQIDLISGILEISPDHTITTTTYTGPITIIFDGSTTSTSPLTAEQYDALKAALFPAPVSTAPPPAPAIGSSPSNPTNLTSGRFAFADTQAGVSFVCRLDAADFVACSSGQSYVGLAQGGHTFSVEAKDGAGATSTAATFSWTIDTTPPSISGAAAPAPNGNGWNNTNVTVSFTCSDALSGVASCPAPATLATEGRGQSATGSATDRAGNTNGASVTGINIDKTRPAVTYAGNSASYTVDQSVNITCTATDALSGIVAATNTCANVSGVAYLFNFGTNAYSASATDRAGNVGMASMSFSVQVTFAGVINLVKRFEPKAEVAANLIAALQGAQAAFAGGNVKSGDAQLTSFINQVVAQSGKSLTAAQVTVLTRCATALMR